MPLLQNITIIALCYLLGSIPFGLLVTKLAGLGDIRGIGSGNIGATNVLRTGRKSLAALTVLLDGGKGAAAVVLATHFLPGYEQLAGISALLGHLFPVWLNFRGGKGVATTLGVLLALAWPVGLFTILLWILVALVTRYSSLAALISIGSSPFAAIWLGHMHVAWFCAVGVGLIFATHKTNIKRLLAGTESKIGKSR